MKTIAWDIWLYCNYDCKFCVTKSKLFPEKIYDVDEILNAWANVYNKYGRCKICITGGEPLLYPNFNLIIKKLSDIHNLHITTNLSPDIGFLSDRNIGRDNVFFNITFHPYYTDIKTFIDKLLQLQKYKYDFSICYMNDKFQMSEMLNYNKIFNEYGFKLVPVSYDNDDKKIKILSKFLYNNFIEEYDNMTDSFKNKTLCNAGVNYACVDKDGNGFSCSVLKRNLGNIFEKTFSFSDARISCIEKCRLYENKY